VAEAYMDARAFTEGNLADALHVATAACAGIEVVVSWNFRHIVRAWTIRLVNEVNAPAGPAQPGHLHPRGGDRRCWRRI
jgi:hypothetical protein